MTLIDKIVDLRKVNSLSKHEQLVQGVIQAIDAKILIVGDQLPSINQMVAELGYARKTIVKAYEELKERGLIESKKLKGYFIISKETKVTLRIALLLFSFQNFQQEFYNTFRKEMGKRFQIDVFFHHNNNAIFETIFHNIYGKYGMYVIAPIQNETAPKLLEKIAPDKLLIIDRFIPINKEYSYISQEFEKSTYDKLVELLPRIKKYNKLILFFRDDADYPVGILKAFNKFIEDYNIIGSVEKKYKKNSIKKGYLYFFISDNFLWQVLKDSRNKEFTIGKDFGVLSHNDHVVKQFVFGGITTISTSFEKMALKAADHIKNNETNHVIMPLELSDRNSV